MANWGKITSRGDVEDRRSMSPFAFGGLGLTGIALVFLFTFLTGGHTSDALRALENIVMEQPQQVYDTNPATDQPPGQDTYALFASEVLGSTNDMWKHEFSRLGKTYREPKLVLFRQATQSGCGLATSDEGPHYCPIDHTIYLDETFFDEFYNRFGVRSGDVGQAYVIAHEAGHHAQNELGTMDKVQAAEQRNSSNANELSIKLELQADCYAGLWLHSIKDKNIYQPDEIHEAMDEASAVGDDRLQKETIGTVNPETWTHGSSQQRLMWFDTGNETGSLEACNTFK